MPSLRTESLLAVAGGLLSFLMLAHPLAAQNVAAVQGRVVDSADDPIAGVVVVLHAVTGQAGIELDSDTTDAAGAFELRYEPEDGPLYFVATRMGGDIFMADPFREPPQGPIVLRAGAGVEPLRLDVAGQARPTTSTPAPPTDEGAHGGWWVAAIGAIILGFVAWLVHRGRYRPPRARELMLEIARLDEQRTAAPDGASDESYRARRTELRDRLVEALELDHDADRH